jgi:hypothetical protein
MAVKYDERAIGARQATKVLPNVLLPPMLSRLWQIGLQSHLRTFFCSGKTFGKKWRNIIVNGKSFFRECLGLLLLMEMLLVGFFGSIALHARHIQNDRVMHHTINSGQSRHGIFEDALPFRKHQVGGQHHRFAFIAFRQEGKEHLHFIAIMLDLAAVVKNDTGKFVQFGQFLW